MLQYVPFLKLTFYEKCRQVLLYVLVLASVDSNIIPSKIA